VDFDVEALIEKCAEEIKTSLQVGKARFIYRKARAEIDLYMLSKFKKQQVFMKVRCLPIAVKISWRLFTFYALR